MLYSQSARRGVGPLVRHWVALEQVALLVDAIWNPFSWVWWLVLIAALYELL
jgi:hypothetical protein